MAEINRIWYLFVMKLVDIKSLKFYRHQCSFAAKLPGSVYHLPECGKDDGYVLQRTAGDRQRKEHIKDKEESEAYKREMEQALKKIKELEEAQK